MSKDKDLEDILGDTKPAKAKPAAKKAAAKEETPAKPAKAKPTKDAAEPKAPRVREPLVYNEGEREDIMARVPKLVKKPINSRDLAEKLGTTTRKLRPCLYSLQKKGVITLETGEARTTGMTVSAA